MPSELIPASHLSSLIDLAIKKLYQYVDQRVEDVRPFRAIVTGQSSGMVQIRRLHSSTAETALRARVAGFDLTTNDEVLCVPMADGIPIVVGKVQRSTPTSHAVTPALPGTIIVQEGDSNVDTAVSTLDFAAAHFVVGSSPSGEANIALAHDASVLPFTLLEFDNTGASTSSTSTYSTAVTRTFTLPTGVWTIEALFWGRIGHSADGNLDLRMVIDGTNGTAVTRSGPSTGAYPGGAGSSKASVTGGSRTVSGQIKANTAGTAVMTNAMMAIAAYRTS